MTRKHRILSLAVLLLVLCSFVFTAFPVSSADAGTHRGLLAKATTIESALNAAFLRRADELNALANDYITGVKVPTDSEGNALDVAEESYRLRTLAQRISGIIFDSYALAIIEDTYERAYIGNFHTVETLADEITTLFITYFRVEALNTPELVSDALTIAYMYATGDKYASYYNEEELAEYLADTTAKYSGIGVTVTQLEDGYVEVIGVSPDSPAEKAGILLGDVIIAVNGDDFVELGYSAAINRIRGEKGEAVTITIKRKDAIFDKTIVRAELIEYTISYKMLSADNGKIGYVRISQFDEGTFEQFIDAVEDLSKQGAEKFVFDVRNNLGGRLETVLAIVEYILPDSEIPIVRIEYKSETVAFHTTEEYLRYSKSEGTALTSLLSKYKKAKDHQIDAPIAVLCNGFTASAGELFTSCLQDHDAATVIGKTTYGKGTGQTEFYLTDFFAYGSQYLSYYREAVYNLSTFLYSPPISDNYEGVGVTPDIEASLSDAAAAINFLKLTEDIDDQLKAATDFLATQNGVSHRDDNEDINVYKIFFWIAFGVLATVSVSLCSWFVTALIKEKKRDAFFTEHKAPSDRAE